MPVRDIAREWLDRPMVILICGRGEYAQRLDDDYVSIVHAQSRAQLEARFSEHALIDVAIIEDTPWPGEDAGNVCRTVRARGIGTVFAARTTEVATRLLRDRVTIDLSAADLAEHLDNGVWVACCENYQQNTPDHGYDSLSVASILRADARGPRPRWWCCNGRHALRGS